MIKRKLYRRALPMILSVAMIVQSIPVTSFAAENQTVEEAFAAREVDPEESASAETFLVSTEIDAETNSEEKSIEEINIGEITSEEKISEEEGSEEKRLNEEMDTEDKQSVVKISDDLILGNFKREISEKDKTLFSTQYAPARFNSVQDTVNKHISVEVDGEKLDGMNDSINYIWEIQTKKAEDMEDGKAVYSVLDNGIPRDAAEYRLHIQVPTVKGLCKGCDAYIYFSVSRQELKPKFEVSVNGDIQNLLAVNSADTVGEFKERLSSGYEFDIPNADKKNIVKDFNVNVYIVSAEGVRSAAPLSDETPFYYNKDYIMIVDQPKLDTDADKNYEVALEEYYVIKVNNLIETKVTVELNEPGEEFVKVYDGRPIDVSIIGVKKDGIIELVNVNKVIGGKLVEIPGAKAVPAWYVRSNKVEDNTLQAADYVYTELEEAPTDAGEYYVMYKYVPEGDDADLYEKSASEPIRVTIDPAPVIIVPEAIEIYAGMTEQELHKALAEVQYKLYETVNGAKGNELTYESENAEQEFFGVAYSGDEEKRRAQYYQPQFELQIREKTASKDGEEVKFDEDDKWVSVVPNYLPLKASIESKKEKRQYRIKFTGSKVIYDSLGNVDKTVSITDLTTNSADKNHIVANDIELIKEIPMLAPTRIDTKEIIASFTEKNAENGGDGLLSTPAFKVYDGDALFGSDGKRADYKKAVLYENEQPTDIQDTDDSLTYTWYFTTLDKYEEYISEDEDGRKKFESGDKWDWEKTDIYNNTTNPDDGTLMTPSDSGFYRLEIQYKDPEGVKLSTSTDVYFFIKQQEIIVAAEDRYVLDGDRWNDETITQPPMLYTIYEVPNNDIETFNKLYAEDRDSLKVFSEFDEDSSLDLTWNVRRVKLGTDGQPETDKDNNKIYEKMWQEDTYTEIILYGSREYQAYAYIRDLDANPLYKNYTCETRPVVAADRTDDQKTYRFQPGDIRFIEGRLDISIIKENMPTTRPYDGTPLIKDPEKLKDLIEIKNASGEDLTDQLLNTSAEYNKDLVNVRWVWEFLDEQDKNNPLYTASYGMYDVVPTQEAVYGGTYYLVVEFTGNQDYAAYSYNAYEENNAESREAYSCRITKTPITITPVLCEGLRAGRYVSELYGYNPEDGTDERLPVIVEGLVWKDSSLFDYSEFTGYSAFYPAVTPGTGYDFHITINTDEQAVDSPYEQQYLRYGRTYDVIFTGELAYPWKSSYEVTYKSASTEITRRGESDVRGLVFSGKYTDLLSAYDEEKSTYTIVPREGIRFFYENEGRNLTDVNGDEILFTDGNYIAFKIYVPKEFEGDIDGGGFDSSKFIAVNNVKEAGGYVLRDIWERDTVNGQFLGHIMKVLFPVEADEKGSIITGNPSFTITWEGEEQEADKVYTETFVLNLENAVPEADLRKAVAPKSLAFNGVNTKMAVGEEQQLDVKVTKTQLGDIIYLNYRLAGNVTKNENLSIDPETGRVTALKVTTAPITVEAYPVYRAEDGTVQEIKGAKKATTKIAVTSVTAPVVKKITAIDTAAYIQYTPVADGYRREIYVKKVRKTEVRAWNKEKFEQEIGRMKNGQWQGIFDLAPLYRPDRNDSIQSISLLEPGTNYVVYVRNVSAVRTLDDGSKVTFSANGNVNSFVTTKSMVQVIEPGFKVNEGGPDKKNPVELDADNNYTVKLSAKSAQLSVYGLFKEQEEDGKQAADGYDLRRYELPLKSSNKNLLKYYEEPKLTYVVSDSPNEVYETTNYKDIRSKYAAINAKGKITFKGVDLDGIATVWITVISDNNVIGICSLSITAEPDNIIGKKVKLKVGDTIALSDYLEYKQARKKVPFHRSSGIELETTREEALKNGYQIEYGADNQIYVTAVQPNSKQFVLAVKDKNIGTNGMQAAVALTSAQIDPVKKLKVSYVDNQQITINFTHTGNAEAFEIEVKDARGGVVSKNLVENDIESWDSVRWISAEAPAYKQMQQQWILNDDQWLYTNTLAYFEKTNTYSYTIDNSKIVRLSSYRISVTPVYKLNKAGKAAAANIKTTNIPASNNANMDAVSSIYGGIGVNYKGVRLSVSPYFTSGNTYTLDSGINTDARDRVTDTLTWKSSDTKVASIKAVPGTYTATFKALKQGTTTIEVTSKITKKVIARYLVRVKAVGKGQPGFGGDYEPSWDSAFYNDVLAKWDPLYQGRLEVLTLSNNVTVSDADNTVCDGTWVLFTAPKFGKYIFTRTDGAFMAIYDGRNLDDVDPANMANNTASIEKFLEAGQKVYLKLSGNFIISVSATGFARLTADNTKENPLMIKNDEWISFKASEDNYYVFNGVNVIRYKAGDDKSPVTENSAAGNNGSLAVVLKEGTTLFVQARSTDNTESTSKLWVDYAKDKLSYEDKKEEVEVVLSKEDNTRFIKFTAPNTQKYKFSYEETAGLGVEYLIISDGMDGVRTTMNGVTGTKDDKQVITNEFELVKGQTIVFRFTANNDAFVDKVTAVEVKIKVAFDRVIELRTDKDASVEHDSTKLLSFKVPDDGRYYFKVQKPNDTNAYFTSYLDSDLEVITNFTTKLAVFSITVDANSKVKKGDTIYLRVTNENTETKDDAGDVLVTAEKVWVDSLKEGRSNAVPLKVTDRSNQYWYTFTAEKTGFYELAVAYKNEAQESETYKHNILSAMQYDKVFGTFKTKLGINLSTTGSGEELVVNAGTAKQYMEAGETVTFVLLTNWCGPDDRNADVKTDITVSVTELELMPLTVDSAPKHISIEKLGEEVYYVFTAKETDDYTITLTPGMDTGTYKMYVTGNLNTSWGSSVDDDHHTETLNAGTVKYIVVRSTDMQMSVSGDLKVTSTKAAEITLDSEEITEFNLKPNETKYYTFTAPENSEVGLYYITTEVIKDKDGNVPKVTVEAKGKSGVYRRIFIPYDVWPVSSEINAGYEVFKKGDILRIKITNDKDINDNANVSGSITVGSVKPTMLDREQKPAVSLGRQMWYKYSVPGDGRYSFPVALGENTTNVNIAYLVDSNVAGVLGDNPDGRYLHKGDMVYMLVSSGSDAEQHVTISVPKKITPNILKLEAKNEIKVKGGAAGTTEYYEYEIIEGGYYRFETESLSPECYAYDRYAKRDYSYDDNDIVYLRKGENLFFRVVADKEENIEGKLAITNKDIYNLKDAEASGKVTLAPNKTAYFAYTIYDPGMYVFKSLDVETEGIGNLTGSFQFDPRNGASKVFSDQDFNGGFYFLRSYDETVTKADQLSEVLRVTNNTGDDVEFKIRAERMDPAELDLDDEGDGFPIAKADNKEYKYQFFTFKALEKARYKISSDSKDVRISYINSDRSGSDMRETYGSPDKLFEKSEEVLLVMTYVGERDEVRDIRISAKTVKAEPISGTQYAFKVPARDVVWLEYTFADFSKIYGFTLKKGEEGQYDRLYTCDSILKDAQDGGKTFTMFTKEKIFFRVGNTSNDDVQYVLDVKDKAAIRVAGTEYSTKLTFTEYGQVELLAYTVGADGNYRIIGSVEDEVSKGDFKVQYYDEKGNFVEEINPWENVPDTRMDIQGLKSGQKIYIKVYPWYQGTNDPNAEYVHDVTVKIDKIVDEDQNN